MEEVYRIDLSRFDFVNRVNIRNNVKVVLNKIDIKKHINDIINIIIFKYGRDKKVKINFLIVDMANYRNRNGVYKTYRQCYNEFNEYINVNDTLTLKHIFIIINSFNDDINAFRKRPYDLSDRNNILRYIIKDYDNFRNNEYNDFYYENMFEINVDCYQNYRRDDIYYLTFHELDDYLVLLSYQYIENIKSRNTILTNQINNINIISNDEYKLPIEMIGNLYGFTINIKDGVCFFELNNRGLGCHRIGLEEPPTVEEIERRRARTERFEKELEIKKRLKIKGGKLNYDDLYEKYLKYKTKYLACKKM